MSGSDDVLYQVASWRDAGTGVALATVIKTWGSSPRPAGSQLAVNQDGAFVGSVSGGCVESAVVQEALAVIADGVPRHLEFGVTDEDAWQVGLACGGKIRVFVERIVNRATLDAVLAAREAKRTVVIATALDTGSQRPVYPLEADPGSDDARLVEAARGAAQHDQSGTVEIGNSEVFLHVHSPPLRMVIVGGVHIAQALADLASRLDFAVTVVDPRGAFVTEARFPNVHRSTAWPDQAFAEIGLDGRTAVVTLTHDSKIDEPALAAALRSDVFYIGALGSRRTQSSRIRRLREQGFDDEALGRILGPVGLDIGARSTTEIAVSIAAQVIERLRGKRA